MNPEHEKIVINARKNADERAKGYREQALKLYPWICGRCTREFTHANLRELTVHHRDHNHDNNPARWQQLGIAVPVLPRQRTPKADRSRAWRFSGN